MDAAGDVGRWKRRLAQVTLAACAWAVLVVAAAVWWAGDALWLRLRELGWEMWLAGFALFAMNHLLRFARWHWMLAGEGHAPPVLRSLAIFLAGLALLPTPGKAGVAVRSLLLSHEGVPANVSLAAYFAERLLDLLGLVVLATLVLELGSSGNRWIAAVAVGGGGVIALRMAPWACARLARRFHGWRLARGALGWASHFFEHAARMVRGRRLLGYLALGAAANATIGVLLWLSLARFGTAIPASDAMGVLAISQLSGSLSLLPGGLGGFELAMLAQLALLGTPATDALVALVMVRIATLWGSVLVGLPLLLAGIRRIESHPPGAGRCGERI
jgi:uncharacterized membrane protein YbhN (UPF0104 family)